MTIRNEEREISYVAPENLYDLNLITDVPLDMRGGRTVSDVRVVLTDKVTDVAGVVSDEQWRGVCVLMEERLRADASSRAFDNRECGARSERSDACFHAGWVDPSGEPMG